MHERWQYLLGFYQDLIDKYRWNLEPIIPLLAYLNRTGICGKFYPSTSHEALRISAGATYEERRFRPMVHITYLPDTRRFCFEFSSPHDQAIKEYYHAPFDMAIMYRLEQWLLP